MNAEQRRYLLENYDLKPELLDRLVADIWAFTSGTPELWAQNRHAELHYEGKRNDEIFSIIQHELNTGRFAATPASLRQIRRMIYG